MQKNNNKPNAIYLCMFILYIIIQDVEYYILYLYTV